MSVLVAELHPLGAAFVSSSHHPYLHRSLTRVQVCSLPRLLTKDARTVAPLRAEGLNPSNSWLKFDLAWFPRRGAIQLLLWVLISALLSPLIVTAKEFAPKQVYDDIPTYTYKLKKRIDHDPEAFTQGLEFDENGYLVEGTGLYGKSRLFRGEIGEKSIEVKQSIDLEAKLFGEGLTILDDTIVQTTWRENVGLVFDKTTLEPKESFEYPYEGWGVTKFRGELITTDGTNIIRFWEIGKWKELRSMTVKDPQGNDLQFVLWKTARGDIFKIPIRLNELELIEGELWANLWPTESIARIDPTDGRVKSWVDLRGLRAQAHQAQKALGTGNIDVLNGIAYQAATADRPARLVVTGKLWPLLFELDVNRLDIAPKCSSEGDSEGVCSSQESGEDTGKKKKGRKKHGELFTAAPEVMDEYPEPDFGI